MPRKHTRSHISYTAMRTTEKLIAYHHIPSTAAGNQRHMSFIMGDWNNVKEDAFRQEAANALCVARADQLYASTITAKDMDRRFIVAIFYGHRQ